MTPQGRLNYWHGQANRLPAPIQEGVWTLSPEGVRFITRLSRDGEGHSLLAWEVCTREGAPVGMFFRSTPVP